MQNDDVVHLASALNPVEAHVWRQALEEEGIRCHAVGDYLDAGIGDVPGFQAEIWVQRNDLDRAKAVLEAHRQAHTDEIEEEEKETDE